MTIISCISPIVRAGARPVLVDVDPSTWNMDVTKLEEKITPRTRAILAVHESWLTGALPGLDTWNLTVIGKR